MQERVIAKYPIISVHPNMNIEHGIWYFYTHEIFASPFGFILQPEVRIIEIRNYSLQCKNKTCLVL